MTIRKVLMSSLAVALASSTALAQTGRQLTTSPPAVLNADGSTTTEIISMFWDARCAGNISITLDADAAPNAGIAGATPISLEDTAAAIDAGLQRWNANPASFIDMSVDDIRVVPTIFLDFVNTASFFFPLGGPLGVSISTPLTADTTLTVGLDMDADGDSDVFDPEVEGVDVCTDVDGDGDIEYPAGDYAAGTILDNDVFFGADILWETSPTASIAADIDAVSTHEYGHSHGLTHSSINQISGEDGTTATMIPALATFSPVFEEATRTPHTDDLAASAFIYPEGSDYQGPAAIQRGDIRFDRNFSILEGEVVDANGDPVLAAAVSAINSRGEVVAATFAGDVFERVTVPDPNSTVPGAVIDFESSIDNSRFRLAVPAREVYTLKIEPVDGAPVAPGSISIGAIVADNLGQNDFVEESLSLLEDSAESRIVIDRRVFARPARFARGRTSGLDFVINDETTVENVPPGGVFFSLPFNLPAAGTVVAQSFQFIEMFDRQAILDSLEAGNFLTGLRAGTDTASVAEAPVFSSIDLVTGTVDATTGLVTLGRTFYSGFNNVTTDSGDFTNLDFKLPVLISKKLRIALERDENLQVFMVANIDDIPAASDDAGSIIPFIRPVTAGPDNGTSFFTIDGGPSVSTTGLFTVPFNWDMQLRFAEAPPRSRR